MLAMETCLAATRYNGMQKLRENEKGRERDFLGQDTVLRFEKMSRLLLTD